MEGGFTDNEMGLVEGQMMKYILNTALNKNLTERDRQKLSIHTQFIMRLYDGPSVIRKFLSFPFSIFLC